MRRSFSVFVAAIVACVLTAGCGDSGPKRVTAKVKGKVTFDGQPMKKGRIIFQSANGAPGVGDFKEDGSYELVTGIGANQIAVQNRDPNTNDPKSGMPVLGKSHIPDKYESSKTSGLTFDVQAKDNTADFTLTK